MTSRAVSLWTAYIKARARPVAPDTNLQLGEPHPWDRGGVDFAPEFSALLASATVLPLRMNDSDRELLIWEDGGDTRGWMTEPPAEFGGDHVHPQQRELQRIFGGIIRTAGSDDYWLINQVGILTANAEEFGRGFEEYVSYSDWAWEDEGLDLTFNAKPYSGIANETNGNLTLVHTVSGQVVAFMPDHAFDDVTVFPGCPENTIYTLDEAPNFAAFLEFVARTWREAGPTA